MGGVWPLLLLFSVKACTATEGLKEGQEGDEGEIGRHVIHVHVYVV